MIHKEQIYIFQATRKYFCIGYFEDTKWTIIIVNSRRTDQTKLSKEKDKNTNNDPHKNAQKPED